MTPAKSVFFVTVLVASGVATAQPTPDAAPPQPEPQPDPTPQPPPDGADGGMVAPLPVEPPVEPPPEAPKKDEPPAVSVTWDKGLLFESADERFEAKLALRSQWRLEVSRPTEDGAEFSSHFVIPRLRLQLEGFAFGKDTRYKMEAGLEERGSFSFVKDFFVEHKTGPVWIRVGQWKRPFNRQELVSDFASELNERAITAEFVGGGRDIGIAVHNDYEKSPEGIEWAVGVFNGFSGGGDRPKIATTCTQDPMTGDITCTNAPASNFPTDFSPALVIRAGYNKGKVKGYSEGDLDGGPLRFAVAANYKVDLADLSKGGESSVAKNLSHGVGIDAIAKVQGFDVQVGAFLMKLKSADALLGGMIQLGYMVMPKTGQICARAAAHKLAGTDNYEIEARGAFNYYLAGHAWKISTDAGMLKETGGGDPEIQIRSMVQLTF
jgi:hypothetical protein